MNPPSSTTETKWRNVNAKGCCRLNVGSWGSLVEGDEQLDWPNSQTTMELWHACVSSMFWV